MEKCPNCGRFMNFHLEYFCGIPRVVYTCSCGYDTRRLRNYATTQTVEVPKGADKWMKMNSNL